MAGATFRSSYDMAVRQSHLLDVIFSLDKLPPSTYHSYLLVALGSSCEYCATLDLGPQFVRQLSDICRHQLWPL